MRTCIMPNEIGASASDTAVYTAAIMAMYAICFVFILQHLLILGVRQVAATDGRKRTRIAYYKKIEPIPQSESDNCASSQSPPHVFQASLRHSTSDPQRYSLPEDMP